MIKKTRPVVYMRGLYLPGQRLWSQHGEPGRSSDQARGGGRRRSAGQGRGDVQALDGGLELPRQVSGPESCSHASTHLPTTNRLRGQVRAGRQTDLKVFPYLTFPDLKGPACSKCMTISHSLGKQCSRIIYILLPEQSF